MKENRAAIWALIGVVIGLGMPILACIGLTFAFSLGLTALAAQTPASPNVPVHVSGPLTGPAVAIIDIQGPIVSGRAPPFSTVSVAAADDLISLIRTASQDEDVKAILLEVNSPGGSVVPSDQIYHSLKATRIPIIVLMEDTATSGAYYLSMAANHIFANPNTLTGSIGVISTFPDAHELFEKVGIGFTVIKSGEVKDFGSPYRPMDAQERAYWQGIINETHQGFIEVVAEGRGLSEEAVLALADGRVFTGRRALELNLIDELGYQNDAIAKAAELAAIPGEPRVIRYQKVTPLSAVVGQSLHSAAVIPQVEWLVRGLSPTLEFRWVP